ncbi:MAG: DUF5011 domain-containing protein [Erysipelotrichaceae bacterium]|nr:DUF5011 domain-containing protein [Erysipelotrichaceae bacterium]
MKLKKQGKIVILVILIFCIAMMSFIIIKQKKTLTLVGESEIVMNINEDYDDEGTNIPEAEISGFVDTSQAGDYMLTYTYNDQSVSRIIHVIDESNIVMNLNGSQDTYVKLNETYIESGCHVIDKTDGSNITNEVTITGSVDTSNVGEYTLTYTINYNYITISKERVVHVVEDMDENTDGIAVLMYHYVYTKDDIPDSLNTNYILDTDLEEQLQYLSENNYYFPSYAELAAYVNGTLTLPKKSVILTFDDGQNGFLKYGIPLLEKYQIPATSFVIASKAEDKIVQYASEYVSFQSHSYDMHKAGGTIGHGGIISAMSEQEIIDDLLKAMDIVQNTEAFAYPYGDVTDASQTAVEKTDILCAFTTNYGKVKVGDDLTYLSRVRVIGEASLSSFIASIN